MAALDTGGVADRADPDRDRTEKNSAYHAHAT
jgi:hypothetical protein